MSLPNLKYYHTLAIFLTKSKHKAERIEPRDWLDWLALSGRSENPILENFRIPHSFAGPFILLFLAPAWRVVFLQLEASRKIGTKFHVFRNPGVLD